MSACKMPCVTFSSNIPIKMYCLPAPSFPVHNYPIHPQPRLVESDSEWMHPVSESCLLVNPPAKLECQIVWFMNFEPQFAVSAWDLRISVCAHFWLLHWRVCEAHLSRKIWWKGRLDRETGARRTEGGPRRWSGSWNRKFGTRHFKWSVGAIFTYESW